jgi:hypothetical protein
MQINSILNNKGGSDLNASNLAKTNLDTIALLTNQNKTTSDDENYDIRDQLKELKDKSSRVMQTSTLSQNITDGIIGNDMFSTQLSKLDQDSLEKAKQDALNNNLSIVDLTNCINSIKTYYNITNDSSIIVSKTDSQSDISPSKQVNIQILEADTGEKLDMSLCKSDKVNIQIPIDISDDQLSQYREFKNQSIDIFDPNDPLFNSRCLSYQLNGYDTTLNYRRQNIYSNNTITCNSGCLYTGLSDKSYASCDCTGVTDNTDLASSITSLPMGVLSSFNIGIIKCSDQAFNVYNLITLEIRR